MCAASLNIYDTLALGIIGLGTILFVIDVCAFMFKRHEKYNAHLRAQNG